MTAKLGRDWNVSASTPVYLPGTGGHQLVVTILLTRLFSAIGAMSRGQLAPPRPLSAELPGPRAGGQDYVISEIMFHPALRTDGTQLEFVELFNSQSGFRRTSVGSSFPAPELHVPREHGPPRGRLRGGGARSQPIFRRCMG